MKLNKKLIFIIISGLLLTGIVLKNFSTQSKQKTVKAQINGNEFVLDVADNEELRSKGLSGRNFLVDNSGMIFIFPEKNYYTFWMKDMKFPLDFIWIDDYIIKDITENVFPPVGAELTDIVRVNPGSKINKVIEVSAGTIKKLNLQIGDNVEF